jgi:hypothetical protein
MDEFLLDDKWHAEKDFSPQDAVKKPVLFCAIPVVEPGSEPPGQKTRQVPRTSPEKLDPVENKKMCPLNLYSLVRKGYRKGSG